MLNKSGSGQIGVYCLAVMLFFSVSGRGQQSTEDPLFQFVPDTPAKLVRAAILAQAVERPSLARGYLQKLIDLQPADPDLTALRREFGMGVFIRMSADRDLRPGSVELLRMLNQASRQKTTSAEDVRGLIAQLNNPDTAVAAGLEILSAKGDIVPALLEADPASDSGRIVGRILIKYARRFRHGLLSALQDADETDQVRILKLLGLSGDPEIAADLLRFRFKAASPEISSAAEVALRALWTDGNVPATAGEAAAVLTTRSESLLRRAAKPFATKSDLWNSPAVMLQRAARFSAVVRDLQPNALESVALHMACEAAAMNAPAVWPGNALAIVMQNDGGASDDTVGMERMQSALKIAVDTENAAAMLGLMSHPVAIQGVLNEPVLLKRLMDAADCRVRLIGAGIALNAPGKIAGTSHASTILETAATGRDTAECVIIDSRQNAAIDVAALVGELSTLLDSDSLIQRGDSGLIQPLPARWHGISAQAATNGQMGFEVATRQLNCDMVLVQSNCIQWSLSATIANLRADSRTRNTPVVVYGPERDQSNVGRLQNQYAGIWFLQAPLSVMTFSGALEIADVSEPILSATERQAMIEFAQNVQESRATSQDTSGTE